MISLLVNNGINNARMRLFHAVNNIKHCLEEIYEQYIYIYMLCIGYTAGHIYLIKTVSHLVLRKVVKMVIRNRFNS